MVRVQHQVHDPGIIDGRLRHRRRANPLVLSVNADGVLVAEVRPTGFLRPLRTPVLLPAPRLLIILRLPPKRRHLPHAGLHDLAAPGLVAGLAKRTFESLQPLVQQPDLPPQCFPEPPDRRRVRHTVLKGQTRKSHQGPPVLHRGLQLLVRPAIPARQRPHLEPQPPVAGGSATPEARLRAGLVHQGTKVLPVHHFLEAFQGIALAGELLLAVGKIKPAGLGHGDWKGSLVNPNFIKASVQAGVIRGAQKIFQTLRL